MLMGYSIYEDRATSRAVIHRESCQYFINRKSETLPDNRWHEGFETKDEATRRAQRTGCRYVGECRHCS